MSIRLRENKSTSLLKAIEIEKMLKLLFMLQG